MISPVLFAAEPKPGAVLSQGTEIDLGLNHAPILGVIIYLT
jgi:hypothetical protein